jgi:4-amino-4-deoxy-L-arabinose transferase-like glycosyltransferase
LRNLQGNSNNQLNGLAAAPGRGRQVGALLRAHYGALVIGGLFLLLSFVYSITIPAWEADNEVAHFNYVGYLVKNQALPRINDSIDPPVMTDVCRSGEQNIQSQLTSQFRQPPLYYLLGAAATFWIETDSSGPNAANPFRMWDPNQLGYNFALHDPAREGMPYTGTLLALHMLRVVSGLLALSGLLATYLLGLLLFDGQRPLALAMMAVNAFVPQYVFASAIVNNDIAVAVFSSWCVLCCAYVALVAPRVRFLLLAALTAGLAIVAKYNGVVVLFPLALATAAVVAQAWRAGRRRLLATLLKITLVALLVGVVVVTWLARNQGFYERLLSLYARVGMYGEYLVEGFTTGTAPRVGDAISYAFTTFWGQFGWDTLTLPPWVLAILAVVSAVAALGVVLTLVTRRQARRMRLIVLAGCLFVMITLFQALIKDGGWLAPRGRYLLPAISAIAFLFVAGLHRVLPQRFKLAGVRLAWVGLLALAVAVPFLVLRPAYAPPRVLASAELLPGEEPLHANIGGFAELLGYRVEPQRLAAGDPVEVTLVWKALYETPNNYTLSIHLLDGEKYPRAWVMSHPGHGNFPTSIWRPGDVFRETYQLYWADTPWERLPSQASFKVALLCPGSETVEETQLEATDAQGNALGDAVYFGRIKVLDEQRAADQSTASPPMYTFGDELAIEGYRVMPPQPGAGQQVLLELRWRALQQPMADYTVFAHLVDSQGQLVVGNDQPLTDGYYPSSLWEPSEVVTHTHRLSLPALLPAGSYEIRAGVYEPITGQRLTLSDGNERPVEGDQFLLAAIAVPD